MPRWIAFDAVGTLIHPSPSVAAVYTRAAAEQGSRLSQGEVTCRFRAAFQRRNPEAASFAAFETSDLTTDEDRERVWWRELVSEVIDDIADPSACFEALWSHFADPANWRVFDEVQTTLEQLWGMGFRLAIASNFDGRLHRLCDEMPELARIERRVISSEVGHRKPSVRFYQSMLDRLGCEPSELWMVGDDLLNDVHAAESCGIPALWLDRSGEAGNSSQTTKLRVSPLTKLGEIAERLQLSR